jgi:hypothetical protein
MPRPPTDRERELIEIYADSILQAAETVANHDDMRPLQVEAVAVIIKTKEGWGGTKVGGPEHWTEQHDAMFLIEAVQHQVEALGGSVTFIDPQTAARVTPLVRRNSRRGRPRR